MKILITGSNGQLGHDLMQQAQARGWEAVGADLPGCDITDSGNVSDTFPHRRSRIGGGDQRRGIHSRGCR
jgi:dTDP-4-dehydrorhamnose reductase